MKLKFNQNYFMLFLIFLVTEILIATFISTGFIRHTFGDYIVVMLLYCLLMAFVDLMPKWAACGILIISFIIEFLQLYRILDKLNIAENSLSKLILGNTFSVYDLLAYTLGIATILFVELKLLKK